MSDWHVPERRQFKRVRFSEPIEFHVKNTSQFGGSLSCDLSEGGMRLYLNDFVPLNSEITIQWPLPTNDIVECRGHVAWVEKLPYSDRYQAGVTFSGIESEAISRKKIHKFVKSNQ